MEINKLNKTITITEEDFNILEYLEENFYEIEEEEEEINNYELIYNREKYEDIQLVATHSGFAVRINNFDSFKKIFKKGDTYIYNFIENYNEEEEEINYYYGRRI